MLMKILIRVTKRTERANIDISMVYIRRRNMVFSTFSFICIVRKLDDKSKIQSETDSLSLCIACLRSSCFTYNQGTCLNPRKTFPNTIKSILGLNVGEKISNISLHININIFLYIQNIFIHERYMYSIFHMIKKEDCNCFQCPFSDHEVSNTYLYECQKKSWVALDTQNEEKRTCVAKIT